MKHFVPRAFSEQRLREVGIVPARMVIGAAYQVELGLRLSALAPEETGGVLTTGGDIIEYPNIYAGNKEHGFNMMIDVRPDILALWHTHPSGQINASADDAYFMRQLLRVGVSWPWIVVSPFCVTSWKFADGFSITE